MIEWSLFVNPWVPFTQECFVPNLVIVGPVHEVLEKKIFKFCQGVLLHRDYLSSWKERDLLFEQNWIHFTQGCFIPSLVEIRNWPSGSGEEDVHV